MTWAEHHAKSEEIASSADFERVSGNVQRSRELYALAAEAELRALEDLDLMKARTFGITAVSTVALFLRAKAYERAELQAYRWLSMIDQLPAFAYSDLQSLLQRIWGERAQDEANVEFVPGDVLVAVRGGKVVFGGAPLDLVIRKVEEVKALFYRTAEMLLEVPHRRRGAPSVEIQNVFQPWLFQAPAGSYQFAVRVQEPPQMDLFPNAKPQVAKVVDTFLAMMKASVEDPEGAFRELVPNEEYQSTILKLARNLAPTGGAFTQIEFKDATRTLSEPVMFSPLAREYLNEALRARKPAQVAEEAGRVRKIEGVLRAVHLDKDWLEVVSDGQSLRVVETGDVLDDVIGPMVNGRVIVTVVTGKRGKLLYRDIEPAE